MNELSWISRLRIGPERLALTFLLAINMVGVSYRWAWAVAQPWLGVFWAAPTLTLLACAVLMLTAAPVSEIGNDRRTDPLVLSAIAFSFVLTLYQTTATRGVLLAVPALGAGAVLLLEGGIHALRHHCIHPLVPAKYSVKPLPFAHEPIFVSLNKTILHLMRFLWRAS